MTSKVDCDDKYFCDLNTEIVLEKGTRVSIDKCCSIVISEDVNINSEVVKDVISTLKVFAEEDNPQLELYLDKEQVVQEIDEILNKKKDFELVISSAEDSTTKDQVLGSIWNDMGSNYHEIIGLCPVCGYKKCCNRIFITKVTHFGEMCIFSTMCDKCGYKATSTDQNSNKSDKGHRITLKITSLDDFERYVIQNPTTKIIIEEIGLEAMLTSNSGQFSTIEGLLKKLYELYKSVLHVNLDLPDDAFNSQEESSEYLKARKFLSDFRNVAEMKVIPITLILDDPYSSARIQNIYAPDEDPNMTIEEYEREEVPDDT